MTDISSHSDIPAVILFDPFSTKTPKKNSTVRECVWHVFAHACVSVCACVWTCACVLDREGSWAFASRALVVVWTAMYLTSYSDYLIGLLGLS